MPNANNTSPAILHLTNDDMQHIALMAIGRKLTDSELLSAANLFVNALAWSEWAEEAVKWAVQDSHEEEHSD